jgi:hypothetical protein
VRTGSFGWSWMGYGVSVTPTCLEHAKVDQTRKAVAVRRASTRNGDRVHHYARIYIKLRRMI